jgi:ferrochelatase
MAERGVLLLNLGGPDSLEAVQPFLYNLFSDRDIIQLPFQKAFAKFLSLVRSPKVRKRYARIGGKSPILDITLKQALALEEHLEGYKSYVGMRYWHPTIEEALWQVKEDGVEELVVLPLYPHYTRATTGSCLKELARVKENIGAEFKESRIESFYDNPGYLDTLAGKVRKGLSGFEDPGRVQVVFSAHSIPQKFVDEGDPYIDHIRGTVDGVWKRVGEMGWHLAYQSRTGPVKWVGPGLGETLKELAERGHRDVLVVPVSFVSDHIETLYELDIQYREYAESLGIENFRRTESLNTSERFIDALAGMVLNADFGE